MGLSRIKQIEKQLAHISEQKETLEKELLELQIQEGTVPELKRGKGKRYYSIRYGWNDEGFFISSDEEKFSPFDDRDYRNNNYFPARYKDFAEEIVNKIKFTLLLARYKMLYCPNYEPDWGDPDELKFVIYYDSQKNRYRTDYDYDCRIEDTVYFPSEEIAQHICDILNKIVSPSPIRKE